MTIAAQNYPHVLERFIALDSSRQRTLKELTDEKLELDKQLRAHGKLLDSNDLRFDERLGIHQNVTVIRKRRQECMAAIGDRRVTPLAPKSEQFIHARTDEFRRICASTQLIDAYTDEEDAITLILSATHMFGGALYDLGDWALTFGKFDEPASFAVTNFRNDNVRESWGRGSYPDYTDSNGYFCIGGFNDDIAKLFMADRYHQAIQMVIYVINSVNEHNKADIPLAFYQVSETDREVYVEHTSSMAG